MTSRFTLRHSSRFGFRQPLGKLRGRNPGDVMRNFGSWKERGDEC